MSREGSCVAEVFVSFIVGTLVGAGAALLFAPTSGYETREKIKTATSTATSKGVEMYDEFREMLAHFKEEITSIVDEKLEKVVIKHSETEEKTEEKT